MNISERLRQVVLEEADRRTPDIVGRVLDHTYANPCSYRHCLRELEKRFRRLTYLHSDQTGDLIAAVAPRFDLHEVVHEIRDLQEDLRTMRLVPCEKCLDCHYPTVDPRLTTLPAYRYKHDSKKYDADGVGGQGYGGPDSYLCGGWYMD